MTVIETHLGLFSTVLFLLFLVLSSQFLVAPAGAAVGINRTINFQGKVVNKTTETNIANGDYSFTFRFYDAASGGTQLPSGAGWSETKTLTVTNGIFRTALGDTTTIPTALDFNADNIYLEMVFNGETFTSRIRMTSVPYAFNAEKVAGLTVTNTTGTFTLTNAKTFTVNNTLTLSGTDSKTLTINGSTTLADNAITFGGTQVLTLAATKNVTFADAFSTSGAFPITLTGTASTNVTLPTTGTLATLAGAEVFTNKTIGSTGLVFSGATTDITTGTNEHLALMPNGTGNVGIGTTGPNAKLDITGATSGDAFVVSNSTSIGNIALFKDDATTIASIADGGVATFINSSNSTSAFRVQRADATDVLAVDTTNSQTSLRGINSDASLGSELTSSTTCSGTNWSGSGTGPYIHTTGNTTALSCSPPNSVTAGATYVVTFILSNMTAGTVTPTIGGTNGKAVQIENGASITEVQVITATTTAGVTFIPTSTFDGRVTITSVKQITFSNSVLSVKNSSNSTALDIRGSGTTSNTLIGLDAGRSNTTGTNNTAFGYQALLNNTTASWNTAIGNQALQHNTAGNYNSAVGYQTLNSNTYGYTNSALGYQALYANTTGYRNSVLGYRALYSNISGYNNVALGYEALDDNTTGYQNVAIGMALSANTSGNSNVGISRLALNANTTGSFNIAIGDSALRSNITGVGSVAIGLLALDSSTGNYNTGIGYQALYTNSTGATNTAVGYQALYSNTTGSNNAAFGHLAGYRDPNVNAFVTLGNLSNATAIGYGAQVQASNTLVLGGQGANAVNVGINTTIPTNTFSVSPVQYSTGTASQSGTTITGSGTTWTSAMVGGEFIFADGTKRTITAFNSTTSLTVNTSGTVSSQAYRIHYVGLQVTSAGNVGIGTAGPASRLDLLPTATFGAAGVSGLRQQAHTITLSGADPTTYATFNASQIGAMTLVGTNTGQTVTDAASLNISGAPIKSTNVALTNTHGLLISAGAVSTATNSYGLTVNTQTGATNNYAAAFLGGSVGVGTTTPGRPLEVVGAIRSSRPSDNTAFELYSTTNSAAEWAMFLNNQDMRFFDRTDNRLTLQQGGNVGIGTIGPDRKLDVLDASNPQLRLSQADGTVYADLKVDSDGTFSVINTATNPIFELKNLSTNFGSSAEAGAFISKNSYYGEEWSLDPADDTATTDVAWGDMNGWTVIEQAPTTNDCTFSTLDDTVNGIGRIATADTSTNCLAYLGVPGSTSDAHSVFDADNLPVILMKIRPSAASVNDNTWVGIGDSVGESANPPANGIFFTNNDSTTWTGVTRSASTSTAVACSGATISTTQFALLKIEVVSTTSVKFYVDPDVSNGVQWTSCGSSTTNIPTSALSSMLKMSSTSSGFNLDVDFFRVWQDDAATDLEYASSVESAFSQEPLEVEYSEQALPEARSVLINLLTQEDKIREGVISVIDAERLIGGLEVVTPKVVAREVSLDTLSSSTATDITIHLTKDGKFIIQDPEDPSGNTAIVFDNEGNGTFKGTITADKIKANQIEGLEIIAGRIVALEQKSATGSAAIMGTSTSEYASGSAVASVLSVSSLTVDGIAKMHDVSATQATVSADFRVKGNSLVEGILNVIDTIMTRTLVVSGVADFFAQVVFHDDVSFRGRATFNKDTAGIAIVKKDTQEVEVKFEKEYDDLPIVNVNITFDKIEDEELQQELDNAVLNGEIAYIVTNRTTKGFVIKLNGSTAIDIPFSWSALSVSDKNTADLSLQGGNR